MTRKPATFRIKWHTIVNIIWDTPHPALDGLNALFQIWHPLPQIKTQLCKVQRETIELGDQVAAQIGIGKVHPCFTTFCTRAIPMHVRVFQQHRSFATLPVGFLLQSLFLADFAHHKSDMYQDQIAWYAILRWLSSPATLMS
ncbi:MAG: hypothetical protein JO108_12075 [Acidobacteriaceae bacterium]|nr:hypothetical protein [Acidobacteriaceae bacterium]